MLVSELMHCLSLAEVCHVGALRRYIARSFAQLVPLLSLDAALDATTLDATTLDATTLDATTLDDDAHTLISGGKMGAAGTSLGTVARGGGGWDAAKAARREEAIADLSHLITGNRQRGDGNSGNSGNSALPSSQSGGGRGAVNHLEDALGLLRDGVRLRDYQRDGVAWLLFLSRRYLHGVLADEMGLGKTVQTLVAVAYSAFAERKARRERQMGGDGGVGTHMMRSVKDESMGGAGRGKKTKKQQKGRGGGQTSSRANSSSSTSTSSTSTSSNNTSTSTSSTHRASSPLPSLVVCPPTLVPHWQAECVRFFSGATLSPVAYVGSPSQRKKLLKKLRHDLTRRPGQNNDDEGDGDDGGDGDGKGEERGDAWGIVVVTTYSTLRVDFDDLTKALPRWNYCILDEGHLIRNPSSVTSLAIRRFGAHARHRLVRT